MNHLTACTVFLAYAILDVLYAVYTDAIGKRLPFRAAWCASAIYALSAYGVSTYTENVWYVVPLVAGAFLGTYGTVFILKKTTQRY